MRKYIRHILHKIETFLRTDIRYVLRGGFILSIGQIIGSASGAVLVLAFANLVPAEVYGTYKFVLSVAAVLAAFSLIGLRTTITSAVSRGNEGAFRAGFWHFLKWSFMMPLLAFCVAGYYFFNDNSELGITFLLVGAALPLFRAFSFNASFLTGKKEFTAQVITNSIQTVVPALGMILTLFFTEHILIIIGTYYTLNILIGLIVYHYIFHAYKPNTLEEDQKFSHHLSFMGVLQRATAHIDKILVFHFLGPVQLAIYAFALAVPQELQTINKIVQPLVFPKLSERKIATLQRTLPRKFILYLAACIGMMIAYIYAAPFIYHTFFPYYGESVVYSQVYALSFLILPLVFFKYSLLAHKDTKAMYATETIQPIVRIGCMCVLLPFFGLWGLIAAELLSFLFYGVVVTFFFFKMR